MWTVIVLSILAACGITVGVFVRKKDEKLGMAKITRWKKSWVPITVVIDEDDFLPEEVARVQGAVRKAARFWNEQTGVTLFVPPGEVGIGAVIPMMRHDPLTMEEHENAVAYTTLAIGWRGDLVRAVVYLADWENLPSLILARAMKHEFGHCLGLDHDDIEFSVMYGKVSQRVYCVSGPDKAFLKEVYG